jgi:hypothetical protein
MDRLIYDLLTRIGGAAQLDEPATRADLLTSREVAAVLAVGAVEARHVVGHRDVVRNALADVALTWCRFVVPQTPAQPMPDAVRVLGAVASGMTFVASDVAIREALRWLVTSDPFWAMPLTSRTRTTT